MMTGQTAACCNHVYAWDQNNAHALVYAQKKSVSFLYAQGVITGEYGMVAHETYTMFTRASIAS